MANTVTESHAQRIFQIAIAEARCAELLMTLFEGGSVAIDRNGKLALINAAHLVEMIKDDEHEEWPDEREYPEEDEG